MSFEPIAIIGQSCLFPGANSPEALWRVSLEKKDCLTPLPEGNQGWVVNPGKLFHTYHPEYTKGIRGGFVNGFNEIFDPNGFTIPAEEIQQLDPVVQWPLHLARAAFQQTRYDCQDLGELSVGVIFANLSYPTRQLAEFTFQTWLNQQQPELRTLFSKQLNPQSRFMSGLPAQMVAAALNLSGTAFTLDAACGSTIYALQLACRELHTRRANIMVAGGINAIDEILPIMGFAALQALSKSGRSLPFDRAADGLMPAEGGGMFILKRLNDAVRDQDHILGVIRGIGLSNDGRSSGLLVPSITGQVLSMHRAYETSGLDPKTISYVECHATGTVAGDGVEIRSMQQVFSENNHLHLSALKSNIGHAMTAATAGGLNRVLCAMSTGILPPIRYLNEPIEVLKNSQFSVITEPTSWQETTGPLRAGVNGFGMGGTNAHLIVEQYQPLALSGITVPNNTNASPQQEPIAIIAMHSMVAGADGPEDLADHLLRGQSLLQEIDGVWQGRIEQIELPLRLHFPPNDLKESLGQHLAILHSGLQAMRKVKQSVDGERTGIYIGMGCDPETARRFIRCVLPELFAENGITTSSQWMQQALNMIATTNRAAHTLGAMPNIIATRLAVEADCKGPAFAVCGEELSGIHALQIAVDALRAGDIDMAVIGAVDMSCDITHRTAADAVLSPAKHTPGDAAIVLILKRLADAREANEEIIAIINDIESEATQAPCFSINETTYTPLFGHAHAASGLLHLGLAALACNYQLIPATNGKKFPTPWLTLDAPCTAKIEINSFNQQKRNVLLTTDPHAHRKPFVLNRAPDLYCFSGNDRQEIIRAIQNNNRSQNGLAKLAIIADNEVVLQQKLTLALRLLQNQNSKVLNLPHQGIYYRDNPLPGKVAFVFASSNTSYPDMGIDLVLAFPELVAKMQQHYSGLQKMFSALYGDALAANNFQEEGSIIGTLSSLHFLLSHEVLNIKEDSIFGHSIGEFNALTALDIFSNLDEMKQISEKTELYTRYLNGEYLALRQYHPNLPAESIGWQSWRIHAEVEAVKRILADETYCHLAIINTPTDCIITGIPQACQRVISKFRPQDVHPLKNTNVVHCPEVHAVAQTWYRLYHQPVRSNNTLFYSCITGKPYSLTSDSIAEHMLKVGTGMVDFPKLIQNAWDDGVRIFIEHGPQGLCSHWIKEILGTKDYVVAHYDQPGRPGLTQVMHVIAELLVAGLDVNYELFSDRVHQHE